jgi:group I intron endonuclease
MIIYKITNLVTNKIYIGQTSKTIKRRLQLHINDSKRSNTRLSNSIKKYGGFNFIIEELFNGDLTRTEADEIETYYIKYYASQHRDIGYNIKNGGNSVPMTQATKDKISIKNKGRKCSEKELNVRKLKYVDRYSKNKLEEIRVNNSLSKSGGKNPRAIKIINIETGEIFDCIKHAAINYNIKKATLSWQLKNNKSKIFRYL